MSEQLQLTYELLYNVAGRDFIRANFKTSNQVAYWIPFEKVSVRDGYNKREDYEGLDELAESIFQNGLTTPFQLSVLKDGRNLIKAGHRRFHAINMLIEQGKWEKDAQVKFFPVSKDETEFEMLIDQIISNEQKPFTFLEQSKVVFEAKHNFSEKPKSNDELAKIFSKSRQTIDNLIKLAEASDDIKNQVREKTITYSEALSIINNGAKLKKQSDKEEEKAGQGTMYTQPGYVDPLAEELKELKELENTPSPEEEIEKLSDEERQLALDIKKENDYKELLRVSDEIKVNKKNLDNHIGKKLSADVTAEWVEDFVDEDNGEVISIPRTKVLEYKGRELTEEVASQIVEEKIPYIFVYKDGMVPVAPSVISEPVAKKEKGKYESDREEMKWANNIVTLGDKLEVMVNKLDVSEGFKKDISSTVLWIRNDAEALRDWTFKNKKENKR